MSTSPRFMFHSLAAATLLATMAGCETMRGMDDDDDDETPIALADLPAPVRTAVLARTPEANITQLSTEVENGRTLYEVEYTMNGVAHEAEFDASGALVEEGDDDDGDDAEDDD